MKCLRNAGKIIVIGFCIWDFLFWSLSDVFPNHFIQPNSGAIVSIITLFQRVVALFGEFSVVKEIFFCVILYLIYLLKSKGMSFSMPEIIISVAFSVIYMIAESFHFIDSAQMVFGDLFMFGVFVIRCIGLFFIVCYSIHLLFSLFGKKPAPNKQKWPLWKVMVIIGIFWLPCLLCMYPGGYSLDSQIQLRQFFGYEVLSNAQPTFNTFLIGLCVSIGNAIGNSTMGLFLFTLLQFLLMFVMVSYGTCYLINRVNSRIFTIVILIFTSTTSFYVFYASSIGRDATYSACLFLMGVFYLRISEEWGSGNYKKALLYSVLYSAVALLACLLRNNGIYVTVISTLVLVVCFFVNHKKEKIFYGITAILASHVLLYYLSVGVIYPTLGVVDNANSLVQIVMLQNTSRYVMEYPDEVIQEDIEVIDKVIDYSRIEERYNPKTSDGIKPIIRFEADKEAWSDYYNVFFKESCKHPSVILKSSINISYGFFAPIAENTANDFGDWYYASEWPELNFRLPEKLTGFRYLYEMVLTLWDSLPVERIVQIPGLYTWLFTACFVYICTKKKCASLVAFVPGLVTIVFFLVLPSYFGHPRYCFPVVYSVFMYLALCISGEDDCTIGDVGRDEQG